MNQIENRIGNVYRKRYHCVHCHIEKSLIRIVCGGLSFGDFALLWDILQAGNKQAKQQCNQQRKALLHEAVMENPVFHRSQI